MRLISIQIGTPRVYGVPGSDDPMDRVFTSAIGKEPVGGRVWAAQLGLSGDAVADRKSHGGADQALLAYSAEHYPLWRREWLREDVGPGAFGENLTVTETDEDGVCLGDRWQVGTGGVRGVQAAHAVQHPRAPAPEARPHRDGVREWPFGMVCAREKGGLDRVRDDRWFSRTGRTRSGRCAGWRR
jgi:hypothetical protein